MDPHSQARFEKLVKVRVSSLKKEDIAFIRARRSYLSEAQAVAFASILEEEKADDQKPVDYGKMKKADLLNECEKLGIVVPEGSTNPAIAALIEAKLAEEAAE